MKIRSIVLLVAYFELVCFGNLPVVMVFRFLVALLFNKLGCFRVPSDDIY